MIHLRSFTERRRSRLARRVAASFEPMEERNMITESLGIISMGIGVPTGLFAMARPTAGVQTPPSRPIVDTTSIPIGA